MTKDEVIDLIRENLTVSAEITTRSFCGPILITTVKWGSEEISREETSISSSDLNYKYPDY